ncbi:MAG: chorismate synthase, partial [Sporomusaceae bacterium]|nr:chorismate synthase [Sporomusaceae bacterium]
MLRFLTAGESHGPCLTVIMEGLPAGLKLSSEKINEQLARRQQGYGRGGRMKIETDKVTILSGLRFGETLGSPLTLQILNRDWQNWQGKMAPEGLPQGEKVLEPRPGHADLTGLLKYDRSDVRDILERASARETAARVAAGAVARALLEELGIQIYSHVINIGGVKLEKAVTIAELQERNSEVGCVDPIVSEKMKACIDAAKTAGDSLGGVFEVLLLNAPPGLGSYVQYDRKLDAKFAAAFVSIQAIKGVEFGAGFGCADLPGSLIHDEITYSQSG